MSHDSHCCRGVASRRDVLTGLAAFSALALSPARGALAQPAKPHRIDVHYHVFPPETLARATNPAQKGWSLQRALEALDRNGIATGMASSGSTLPPDGARIFNEFGTRIGRDHPGRFGLFAALPLPNVDASLKEIEYALDVLKVDGFGLVTSYGDMWLGDRKIRPVLEELNRRKAVVYVHPTDAPCCTGMSYWEPPVVGSWIEWPMHTARTILSLMLNKVTIDLPGIRFIFAHDGGTMPMLVGRIAGMGQLNTRADFREKFQSLFPQGIEAEYRKLYFDTAQGNYPVNMTAMRSLVDDSHILFGSDYPYFRIEDAVSGLQKFNFPPALVRAIERENAQALFPRLRD